MGMLIHVLTAVTLAASEAGGVIHVDVANCPGPGDGSEQDPYCSIQDAIVAAADTDEIVVAPGTYFELINLLGKAVTLRSSDGPGVTTIDAQHLGSVVSCVNGEGLDTVLQGFTITGGTGTNPNALPAGLAAPGEVTLGGGMLNSQSSPTVIECVFTDNTASFGGGMYNEDSTAEIVACILEGNLTEYDGAAMFNYGGGVTITDSSLSFNFAFNGGGAYNFNSSPTFTNCLINLNFILNIGGGVVNLLGTSTYTDCTFFGSYSIADGGAMYNYLTTTTVTDCTFDECGAERGGGIYNNGSDVTVTGCAFTANYPFLGGGGIYHEDGSVTVTGCTFVGNQADSGGGFLGAGGSSTLSECEFTDNIASDQWGGGAKIGGNAPVITGCSFTGNSAVSGGGLAIAFGTPVVDRCVFTGNNASSSGGGLFTAGSEPEITNCVFTGNHAPTWGGGIMNVASSPAVTNCTLVGNSSNSGGGMHTRVDGNSALVTNCVFWDNDAGVAGESQLADSLGAETFVAYSDVAGGFAGIGNLDADPAFADAGSGDYRLSPASPCIDAADNSAVPVDNTTDLDGNPRRLDVPETPDTGNGTLPVVDMGAYEALGGGCLALTGQEILCHADGTTFTVNLEGLNACTGGTTQLSFTGAGGAAGEQLCFTAIVADGGFCCSTEICVTIPDCAPAPQASDLNGDGAVGIADFLALLAAWGPCPVCDDCPADFDGDCAVGIQDLLTLLADWGDA